MRTRARSGGFSLIEILVVMGLMALITGLFVPSLTGAFRTSADTFVRQTGLLLNQARDRALLTDKLIRLRIDLDKQTFLLEEAPSSFLLAKPPEHSLSEREKEELAKKEGESFQLAKALMNEARALPPSLKIVQVDTPRSKRPITEGVVDVFFFNNGNTDGAILYFETDEKVHHALSLHPVTGQVRMEAKAPAGSP